jgi:hypothetical protein
MDAILAQTAHFHGQEMQSKLPGISWERGDQPTLQRRFLSRQG